MIGIYKITNQVNGKLYIGQSIDIEKRIMDHKTPRAHKRNYPISRAIKKYGKENFSFDVIETCQISDLDKLEQHYIKTLNPHYNICEGGSGTKGHIVPEETKKILSQKNKDYWNSLSEEKKSKILSNLSGPSKGHIVKESTRLKLSQIFRGHTNNTPKTNKLISEFMAKYSKTHDMARRKQAVLQIDKNTGLILKEFQTIKEAAESISVHPTSVLGVIKGRRKTSGGYKWEYKFNKLISEKDEAVKGK